MGIRGLMPFLREACPQAFQRYQASHVANKRVAVDAANIVYRISHRIGSTDPEEIAHHMHVWLMKSLYLNSCSGIYLIGDGSLHLHHKKWEHKRRAKARSGQWALLERSRQLLHRVDNIVETSMPDEQVQELILRSPDLQKAVDAAEASPCVHVDEEEEDPVERIEAATRSTFQNKVAVVRRHLQHDVEKREQRYRVKFSSKEISRICAMVASKDPEEPIMHLDAPGEGELFCSDLSRKNLVDFVLSNDLDVLASGAKRTIRCVREGIVELLDMDVVLRELHVTQREFAMMCVFMGCDFAPYIKGMGAKTAFKHLQRCRKRAKGEELLLFDKDYFDQWPSVIRPTKGYDGDPSMFHAETRSAMLKAWCILVD